MTDEDRARWLEEARIAEQTLGFRIGDIVEIEFGPDSPFGTDPDRPRMDPRRQKLKRVKPALNPNNIRWQYILAR